MYVFSDVGDVHLIRHIHLACRVTHFIGVVYAAGCKVPDSAAHTQRATIFIKFLVPVLPYVMMRQHVRESIPVDIKCHGSMPVWPRFLDHGVSVHVRGIFC